MTHLLVALLISLIALGCGGPEHISPMDPMNPDNSIGFTSVAETRGKIWFGTTGGGLVSFDGKDWKSYTTEDGLPGNWILDIESFEDEIWLVTREDELPLVPQYYPEAMRKEVYRFSPHTGSVKRYEAPDFILYLRSGGRRIFAVARRYLGIYGPGSDEFIWLPVPSRHSVMGSFWDGELMWLIGVALDGSEWEIVSFEPSSRTWRSWSLGPPSVYSLGYEVALAKEGERIWVGTADGALTIIYLSHLPSNEVVTIGSLPVPESYGPFRKAELLLDEDRVWFCSSIGGIYLFPKGDDGAGKSYSWILKDLPGSYALCLHKSGDFLWIGTSKGLIRFDIKGGRSEIFRYPRK